MFPRAGRCSTESSAEPEVHRTAKRSSSGILQPPEKPLAELFSDGPRRQAEQLLLAKHRQYLIQPHDKAAELQDL